MSLIRQAAVLALRSEQLQSQIVSGTPINCDDVIRLASEARRTIENLKAKATGGKPADAAPLLDDYLRAAGA